METIKTNVMRILDKSNIEYKVFYVEPDKVVDGVVNAHLIGKDENSTLKTLVTVGKSKEHYVFIIPVNKSLNLKSAAIAVGEKNIEMITQKELLPLTGFIHLGCSPIGMKHKYKTIADESIKNFENIVISGGKIGVSLELKVKDLEKMTGLTYANCIE